MSFFDDLDVRLEPWDVEYGTEMPLESQEEPSQEDADLDVEVPERDWSAIEPVGAGEPRKLTFVDGVRRIEARLLARRGESLARGAFGSYAVGSVAVSGGNAEIDEVHLERLAVLGSGERFPGPVAILPALTYVPHSTKSTDVDAPLEVLQQSMLVAEERLARRRADEEGVLVVADGPLTFGERLRGQAVGYVKRLHKLYIDRGSGVASRLDLLSRLPAGARTPLFALSSGRFARYSWFLRLAGPHRGESPFSGIVRLEVSDVVGIEAAKRLADATAGTLPRFAPGRGRDPRSPQNLLPLGALEANLRRRLGDVRLIRRHIGALLGKI